MHRNISFDDVINYLDDTYSVTIKDIGQYVSVTIDDHKCSNMY